MKKFTCLLAVFFAAGFLSFQANASGSGGYRHQPAPTPKPVDQVYERGKALFKGREKSYGGVKVCVSNADTGKAVKVKKKYLKPYKSGSANELAKSLYNCNNPDEKISQIYQRQDLSALVHYLNKRYKLKLSYQ